MQVRRQVAVNGSGGAFVTIAASMPIVRMEVVEADDVTLAGQGLDYKTLDDNFATTQKVKAGGLIEIGSKPADDRARIIGMGAQTSANGGSSNTAATPMVQVRSQTATASKVTVIEYDR